MGVRLRFGSFAPLLESPRIRALASGSPWLFAGEFLHQAGLRAFSAGEYRTAVTLFEGAAARYREELKTEPLARVRVHQLMAAVCASGDRLNPLSLEVDRALTRLERIESPAPPYDLVPAHVLLASWLAGVQAEPDEQRLAA